MTRVQSHISRAAATNARTHTHTTSCTITSGITTNNSCSQSIYITCLDHVCRYSFNSPTCRLRCDVIDILIPHVDRSE